MYYGALEVLPSLLRTAAQVRVFRAKKVLTMNDRLPQAQAVAVVQGTIAAVGPWREMQQYLGRAGVRYEVDDAFAGAYLLPGFIEAHMHAQHSGVSMNHVYVGYFDRHDPAGGIVKGCRSVEEIVARLREAYHKNAGRYDDRYWLNAYGVDPLVLGDVALNSRLLDTVSEEIPICINHMSGHLMTINSRAIALSQIEAIKAPNIGRYADGSCNGNVMEPEFMAHVVKAGGMRIKGSAQEIAERATRDIAQIARVNGCTTITDKAFGFLLVPQSKEAYRAVLKEKAQRLPVRLVVEPLYDCLDDIFGGWEGLAAYRSEMENDRFLFGNMKLLSDGSIQGHTACLLDERYYDGQENGGMIMDQAALQSSIRDIEEHGYAVSVHTNGNGATENLLQVFEALRSENPAALYRHSLEHNQLVTEEQLYRMKKYGVSANFFINHIYFWGDVHAKYTVGPHAVKRMNPLRSALRHGIRFGIHSDEPVTEVNPLFSAWVACNRRAAVSGRVYGEDQCLTVAEALRLITVNAAWLLHQEDRLGSIETGKWADFTALAEEPDESRRADLKDIAILGTVSGGVVE